MPNTTYHLLSEVEPFSEFYGGAISRWVANVLRGDSNSVIVCPSTDDSWNFPPESVLSLSSLARYTRVRGHFTRSLWPLHHALIRHIFRPVLERLRPGDIVWIHNRPQYALALARHVHRAGGSVVLHLQNSHLIHVPKVLMRRIRLDRIVFISEFLLKEAHQKFPALDASSVLYSGADESIFYPAAVRKETGTPTVLFVGRLVEQKGVHVLIAAMKLLQQQGVRLQAKIVGSSHYGAGQETEYIRTLKATSPATVTFLPYCSGAALGDLFREADIFCSPSVWEEPFGLVNVEALASGIPVVSTRSGGIAEILSTGGGILVDSGSEIQLASALRALAEDPGLRTCLGRQGHAAFRERFTWSIARAQMQEIQKLVTA